MVIKLTSALNGLNPRQVRHLRPKGFQTPNTKAGLSFMSYLRLHLALSLPYVISKLRPLCGMKRCTSGLAINFF